MAKQYVIMEFDEKDVVEFIENMNEETIDITHPDAKIVCILDQQPSGCCPSCNGSGWGGRASSPETNGKCADCFGTGHVHDEVIAGG